MKRGFLSEGNNDFNIAEESYYGEENVGALLLRLVSPLFCIGEIKWRMVNLEEVSLNISSSVFTSPSFIFLVIN